MSISNFLGRGIMNPSVVRHTTEPLAKTVWFDDATMHVVLVDGREISVPFEWFPRH